MNLRAFGNRRLVIALVIGASVFTIGDAFAASLGFPSGPALGAGRQVVTSPCTTTTPTYTVTYTNPVTFTDDNTPYIEKVHLLGSNCLTGTYKVVVRLLGPGHVASETVNGITKLDLTTGFDVTLTTAFQVEWLDSLSVVISG